MPKLVEDIEDAKGWITLHHLWGFLAGFMIGTIFGFAI